jgi:predicted Rossmann fold flavoprotein
LPDKIAFSDTQPLRIAVVGAGPAGLMAASRAAERGLVTLFERNEKPGKKLYITGKGRCNLTNNCAPDEFLRHVVTNPRFLYSAIYAFPPEKTIRFFEAQGLKTKTERGGRVFPASDKASDVSKALVLCASRGGVEIVYEDVRAVSREETGFTVRTRGGAQRFDRVILAAGGMSYPSTGSNGDGLELAKKLGHPIVPCRPALVPLVFSSPPVGLAGLSLKNVNASLINCPGSPTAFGEMLFTQTGASGPAVLSLSSYIRSDEFFGIALCLDLKPALDAETLDRRLLREFSAAPNKQLSSVLAALLPRALIPCVLGAAALDGAAFVHSVTKPMREKLTATLKNLRFPLAGRGGFHQAVVTSGGVDVSRVNPKTMESRLVPGLFFAGEMLDVDALTGGYNIQIALSTGYAAGAVDSVLEQV